jgi:hypothetical protein
VPYVHFLLFQRKIESLQGIEKKEDWLSISMNQLSESPEGRKIRAAFRGNLLDFMKVGIAIQ